MIGFDFKFIDELKKVSEAADKAVGRNLFKSAGKIRRVAVGSITRSPDASAPGTPPHTRRGDIRRAILFDVDRSKRNAVVGPRYSVVGPAAAVQEFGEEYYGVQYPERPFMGPALDEVAPDFAAGFSGSIGN